MLFSNWPKNGRIAENCPVFIVRYSIVSFLLQFLIVHAEIEDNGKSVIFERERIDVVGRAFDTLEITAISIL